MVHASKQMLKKVLPVKVVDWVRAAELRRYQRRHHPVVYESVRGPLSYNQDGLATRHNCDFMKDPRFAHAYEAGRATGSWEGAVVHWRAYIACWCAERAKTLPGDFVECGVNKGGLARTVMHYVNFKSLSKTFYLLDTFCGLAEQYISEQELVNGVQYHQYEECYEQVKETFKDLPNVEIIRGTVPDTLPLVKAREVCYLSIDMNCSAPEIAAAEFFWDKMVSGATMLLDDYGWKLHSAQKHAFDKFASARGVQVLALPTGQGLIVKP